MCWVAASPKVVGASSTERQLPIYCVQKDYKVVSVSFDAAWDDGRVRQFSIAKIEVGRCAERLRPNAKNLAKLAKLEI